MIKKSSLAPGVGEKKLGDLNEGDIFGEISFLDSVGASASGI